MNSEAIAHIQEALVFLEAHAAGDEIVHRQLDVVHHEVQDGVAGGSMGWTLVVDQVIGRRIRKVKALHKPGLVEVEEKKNDSEH